MDPGHFGRFTTLRAGFIAICAASLVAVAAPRADAFSLEAVNVHAGPVWIGNAYTTTADGTPVHGSDKSPLNLSGSAGVRFRVSENLLFSPLLSIHYQEYLKPGGDKVVPTQIETGGESGDIAGLLTAVLATPWLFPRQIGESWEIAMGGSPTVSFRIPIRAIAGEAAPVVAHFYSDVRFLSPEAYVSVTRAFNERVDIGGTIRATIPIHNLWYEHEVAFWDEMQVFANMAVRIHF
ncbi:MAG: hypothetical protein ACOCYC_03395 [bacterium]